MRVLLAVDGSACSELAVQTVIDGFRPGETDVKVIHAVEWMREMPLCFQYGAGVEAGQDVMGSRKASFDRAREMVEHVAAQLEFKGFHASVSIPDADPRHAIVAGGSNGCSLEASPSRLYGMRRVRSISFAFRPRQSATHCNRGRPLIRKERPFRRVAPVTAYESQSRVSLARRPACRRGVPD